MFARQRHLLSPSKNARYPPKSDREKRLRKLFLFVYPIFYPFFPKTKELPCLRPCGVGSFHVSRPCCWISHHVSVRSRVNHHWSRWWGHPAVCNSRHLDAELPSRRHGVPYLCEDDSVPWVKMVKIANSNSRRENDYYLHSAVLSS